MHLFKTITRGSLRGAFYAIWHGSFSWVILGFTQCFASLIVLLKPTFIVFSF